MLWSLVALLAVIVFFIWHLNKKPSNYPPGPWGFPLIGYIPLSLKDLNKTVLEFRDKYGDIFSWRVGSKIIVYLCEYDMMKEAFSGQDFVNRPSIKMLTFIQGEKVLGIIQTNETHWQNNRRFCMKHLRELGMGKSKILSAMQNEADEFVTDLKKRAGRPTTMPHSLATAILNIIWQMVASKRYNFDDDVLIKLSELVRDVHECGAKLAILDAFPWINYILPEFLINKFIDKHLQQKLSKELVRFFQSFITEHLETLDENDPRDFIDAYLIEMNKQKDNPESTMSVQDLIFLMSDLFETGTETITSSLHWAILFMAKYPHTQKKLQEEIDQFLPKGTAPSLEDRAKLNYTEAFMNESLRLGLTTPNSGPHVATRDVKFRGYIIPKDAIILSCIDATHRNGKYYDSPNDFRPERFLDEDGKCFLPKDGFLPFGIGKRQCVGEPLGRMEFFVFLVTLVQNLKFEAPLGEEDFILERVNHPFISPPKPHLKVVITVRD